jgi:hypothetical protein
VALAVAPEVLLGRRVLVLFLLARAEVTVALFFMSFLLALTEVSVALLGQGVFLALLLPGAEVPVGLVALLATLHAVLLGIVDSPSCYLGVNCPASTRFVTSSARRSHCVTNPASVGL